MLHLSYVCAVAIGLKWYYQDISQYFPIIIKKYEILPVLLSWLGLVTWVGK